MIEGLNSCPSLFVLSAGAILHIMQLVADTVILVLFIYNYSIYLYFVLACVFSFHFKYFIETVNKTTFKNFSN